MVTPAPRGVVFWVLTIGMGLSLCGGMMFWFSNTDPSVALLIRVYLFTSALAALVPILGIIGYIRQSKPIISIGMLALFVSVGPLAQYVAAGVQTLHLAGARQIAGFAGNILQIAGLACFLIALKFVVVMPKNKEWISFAIHQLAALLWLVSSILFITQPLAAAGVAAKSFILALWSSIITFNRSSSLRVALTTVAIYALFNWVTLLGTTRDGVLETAVRLVIAATAVHMFAILAEYSISLPIRDSMKPKAESNYFPLN